MDQERDQNTLLVLPYFAGKYKEEKNDVKAL